MAHSQTARIEALEAQVGLLLTQREYRRIKSEAIDRACVMPKGKAKGNTDE